MDRVIKVITGFCGMLMFNHCMIGEAHQIPKMSLTVDKIEHWTWANTKALRLLRRRNDGNWNVWNYETQHWTYNVPNQIIMAICEKYVGNGVYAGLGKKIIEFDKHNKLTYNHIMYNEEGNSRFVMQNNT